MALAITAPATLPDGRVGLDYDKAAVTAAAADGTEPYTWELDTGGTNPDGLVINSLTGKLSGIITDDPGDYEVWIKVTDAAMDSVVSKIPMFVSAMPNGLDLLLRLPVKDQPGAVLTQLNLIAASALSMITGYTGVSFPADGETTVPQFGPEPLHRNRYSQLAFPDHRPIQSIVSAADGTQTLVAGTMAEFVAGTAQIAIDNRGNAFRLYGEARFDGLSQTVVTYTAGFAELPKDLYEVFCQLGLLIWKERDRVGLSSLSVDSGSTNYQKELPEYCLGVLERYGRVGQWV